MLHGRWRWMGMAVVLGLVAAGVCPGDDRPAAQDEQAVIKAAARALVERLAKEDFDGAVQAFEPYLARWQTADRLRAKWQEAVQKGGPFQGQGEPVLKERPSGTSATITCTFARRRYDVRAVINGEGKVENFAFMPSPLGGPGLIRASAATIARPGQEGATGTITFPIPGTYRDQVPLSFAVKATPPEAMKGFRWRQREDGLNWLCEVTVAPPKDGVLVRWEGLVLVGDRPVQALPAAASAEVPRETEPWIQATATVQSGDPAIRAKAEELANGITDVGEYAKRVTAFAASNPLRARQFRTLDARNALDCGGSCTSRAQLGAALLRARGIPARTVAHLPTWAGPHYEHWLVEYWHPGAGWVWLETSLDQVQPPPWTLVVINVANPADEDCRAFTPAKERGVAEGAPYQAVIELSADLRPDFTVRDESVSNYATPEVRFHGGDQDLKDLFTAARRAFAGLARQAADGKQDPERTGRLLTAAAGGDVRKVTEAVGR